MIGDGNIIYSKRYLPPCALVSSETASGKDPSACEQLPTESFDQFYKNMCEKTVYILNPKKKKRSILFIELAKKVSVDGEIDIDIIEYPYHITARLYIECACYILAENYELAELLSLSDSICFWEPKGEEKNIIIELDYSKHDRYFNGRKRS